MIKTRTEDPLTMDEAIQYFVDMYTLAMHGIKNKNEVQRVIKQAQSANDEFSKREALTDLVNVDFETIMPPSQSQQMNTALTGA